MVSASQRLTQHAQLYRRDHFDGVDVDAFVSMYLDGRVDIVTSLGAFGEMEVSEAASQKIVRNEQQQYEVIITIFYIAGRKFKE